MRKSILILNIIVFAVFVSPILAQEWRVLPIRSKIEYENNMPGGEGEQHPHSIVRSLNNPNYIYLSQDVGGCWQSNDAGDTWRKTNDKGLFLSYGQSIQVDPNDPNLVFMTVSYGYFKQGEPNEGLYMSTDGGENWEHVLKTSVNFNPSIHRINRHNISYDLSTAIEGKTATRWYSVFPENGIYSSVDNGKTWGDKISSLVGHSIVYFVQTHPADGKTIYVGSDKGLFVSDSRGSNLKTLGDLPPGDISSIAINPDNTEIIYVTIRDGALYKSDNGGESFSKIKDGLYSKVVINYGFPNKIYLVGKSNEPSIYSNNGGDDWVDFGEAITFPGLGRETGWRRWVDGDLSGLVPNPQVEDEFVAYSRSTIFKKVDNTTPIHESATGWTGNAWSWWTDGAIFDPSDANRIAFFNCDVGMKISLTGGNYFEENTNTSSWSWYKRGKIKWVGAYSGDFQPKEGSEVIVASIGGYFNTQLMRSENNGSSWSLVTEGNEQEDYNLFVAFHPNDPNFVYAGNKISTDAGKTFSIINFPTKYTDPTIVGMCNAYPDVVYAMDRNREYLLRSSDRGATWQEYSKPGWLFRNFDSIPIFASDPKDPYRIYTYDANSDLASFDGTTWRSFNILDLAQGHEGINLVRSVVVDPNFPNIIYAGTFEMGLPNIFRTLDGGDTWKDITFNSPRNSVTAIKVNPHTGELYRGSSNGTWIFTAPKEFYLNNDEVSSETEDVFKSKNYPNPFSEETNIEYTVPNKSKVTLEVFNSLGNRVSILVEDIQKAGRYSAKFNAKDLSPGMYFYKLRINEYLEFKKMMLVK